MRRRLLVVMFAAACAPTLPPEPKGVPTSPLRRQAAAQIDEMDESCGPDAMPKGSVCVVIGHRRFKLAPDGATIELGETTLSR